MFEFMFAVGFICMIIFVADRVVANIPFTKFEEKFYGITAEEYRESVERNNR